MLMFPAPFFCSVIVYAERLSSVNTKRALTKPVAAGLDRAEVGCVLAFVAALCCLRGCLVLTLCLPCACLVLAFVAALYLPCACLRACLRGWQWLCTSARIASSYSSTHQHTPTHTKHPEEYIETRQPTGCCLLYIPVAHISCGSRVPYMGYLVFGWTEIRLSSKRRIFNSPGMRRIYYIIPSDACSLLLVQGRRAV